MDEWLGIGRFALDIVGVTVVVLTYLKTTKVERHTNGMQKRLEEQAEAKGRRDQKAADGNA